MRFSIGLLIAIIALSACRPDQVETSLKLGAAMLSAADTSAETQCRIASDYSKQAERQYRASRDTALENKLQSMVDNIAYANQLNEFDYRVSLLANKEENAFTPGCGRVYVNEGFIKLAKTEAQMAMVLAHEMVHGERGHSVKRRRDQTAFAVALVALDSVSGVGGSGFGKLGKELAVSTALSQYSQSAESEADSIGFQYFVNAGYRPIEAGRVFENMERTRGSNPAFMNAVAGSHPTASSRAKVLRDRARSLDAERQKSGIKNTDEWLRLTSKYR